MQKTAIQPKPDSGAPNQKTEPSVGFKDKIVHSLLGTPFGNKVLFQLYTIRLANRLVSSMNKKKASQAFQNPTPEMILSQKFFTGNAERAEKVASWLADEASRDAYLKMIDFRSFSNPDSFPDYDYHSQYFFHDFLRYTNEEVLIDCGAFVGDSIPRYFKALKRYHGNYKKYVAIEPDSNNFAFLERMQKQKPGFTLIKAGVYSHDTTLSFGTGSLGDSRLSNSDAPPPSDLFTTVSVKAIDNISECHDATFIKMDIEGAELDALKGAEKTIRKNKPVLAICIYHSDEDMIRIAEWIHGLDLGYRLYVRHHTAYLRMETVLYAV